MRLEGNDLVPSWVMLCLAAAMTFGHCADDALGTEPNTEVAWQKVVVDHYVAKVLPYQTARCAVSVHVAPGAAYDKNLDPYLAMGFFRQSTRPKFGEYWWPISADDTAINVGYWSVAFSSALGIRMKRSTSEALYGFEMSLDVPLSGNPYAKYSLSSRGSQMFQSSGSEELIFAESWANESQLRSAPRLTIRVIEPTRAEDLEALVAIERDENLRVAVCLPLVGYEPKIFAELKQYVEKHPKSSYADYWRLAIAARIIGDRDAHLQDEAFWHEQLWPHVRAGSVGWLSESSCLLPGRDREQIERALINAAALVKGSEGDQGRAVELLQTLVRADADDRREAIKYLLQIESKEFAHYPSVLILLRKLYLIDEPVKAEELTRRLNEQYADNFEWLREQEAELTPESWKKLRIKVAEK